MRKSLLLSVALMFVLTISKAQTVMPLSGLDCNGVSHDLIADLDAGKAVILHFFMINCGSCPPPAQKIQAMANHILATHPGMITAYAIPFNNSTTCVQAAAWVSSSNLSLYAPFDSGATQVANYGGFGMPTVVLLGGTDHRVMFNTQSFATSDTTEMRDSILALLGSATATAPAVGAVNSFEMFPNPANDKVSINLELNQNANLFVDITDLTGKQVAVIMDEKQNGSVARQFSTGNLPNGYYLVRLSANGMTVTRKLNVLH